MQREIIISYSGSLKTEVHLCATMLKKFGFSVFYYSDTTHAGSRRRGQLGSQLPKPH